MIRDGNQWKHRKETKALNGKMVCGAKSHNFSKALCGCDKPEPYPETAPAAQTEAECI